MDIKNIQGFDWDWVDRRPPLRNNQKISGGLTFVRKVGTKTILLTILNTEDVESLFTEHQHVTLVTHNPDMVTLNVMENHKIDCSGATVGDSLSDIACKPIWRN